MVDFDENPHPDYEDQDLDDLIGPALSGLNESMMNLLKTQIAVIIDDTSMNTDQKAEMIAGIFWDTLKE